MKYLRIIALLFTLPLKAHELQIFTPKGPLKFQVETALSASEQKQELMHRHNLKEKTGTLFIKSPYNSVSMWMKDTPLSLDMIFINPQGIITHIEESATPYSTRIIGPYKNIMGVFEILGGTCQKMEISKGYKVSFDLFQ